VNRTRLGPDAITAVSFAVGLGAAAGFAAIDPLLVVAALLAFHLHVLLDYVDGEVARCRDAATTRGAYFDLMTDRITFPLAVFTAGVGAFRATGNAHALVLAWAAAFGLVADKEACDCWYRANAGRADVEDRYGVAPERTRGRRWRGRLALLVARSRGLTALLTYTAIAALLDAAGVPAPGGAGSLRLVVLAPFAVLMPLGALGRFLYVYRYGVIPRRQDLV